MGKLIPASFIDNLQSKVDIADVIGERIDLSKKGNEYSALCPFHEEKTSSFTVNSNKQFYYCFGCKEGGNAITFIMKYEGVAFREAIEILSEAVGLEIPISEPTELEKNELDISTVLEAAENAYSAAIKDSDTVAKFIKDCGISESTKDRYVLGFSANSAMKSIHAMGEKKLLSAGLIQQGKKTLKHWSDNKLILSVKDRRGAVKGFVSQPMNSAKPTTSNVTGLFDSSNELYGLHEALDVTRQTDTLIIVERPLEVLVLHSYGIQCAVSTINSHITKKTLDSLFKTASNIVFCYSSARIRDNDFSETLKISLSCLREGRDIAFLILPSKSRNCASYLAENGADKFHALVDVAIPVVDLLYKKLSSNKDLKGDEKQEWVRQQGLIALTSVPSSLYRRLSIKHFEALSKS